MGVCGSIPHTPTKLEIAIAACVLAACDSKTGRELPLVQPVAQALLGDAAIDTRAALDDTLRDAGIELVLATPATAQLDTTPCAASTDTRCMRCELAPATSELHPIQLRDALEPIAFARAAGMKRLVICAKLSYLADHGAPPSATVDFARGAVLVEQSVLAGTARTVIQHELFHLFDMEQPTRDRAWLALNPRGFRYGGRASAGFAREYGTTTIREDKATVYEAIVARELCTRTDRTLLAKARLVRARIRAALGDAAAYLDDASPCLTDSR